MATIYDFQIHDIQNKNYDLEQLRGKIVLIVNVASKCGFTPQYKGLEELYKKFKEKGLVILGFPCNQFGAQEPGNADEIQSFCSLNYDVTFPIMEKVDVNGKDAHPIYEFLKSNAPGILGTEVIKWNFTKFLIDQTGHVIERFAPTTKPEDLHDKIAALLT